MSRSPNTKCASRATTCRWRSRPRQRGELMRVATAAVFGVTLLGCLSLGSAQAQQATPRPDVPPTGEFRVTPSSGPPGTVVTLTVQVDQPITWIQFRCDWRRVAAFDNLYLSEPASNVSLQFEIPALLSVRQPRPGEEQLIEPSPEAKCSFHAISWHKHLYAAVPFMVTAPGLPVTGLSIRPADQTPLLVIAALAGLGVMASAAGYALRNRTRGQGEDVQVAAG